MNNTRAGKIAESRDLINVSDVLNAYYEIVPDLNNVEQKIVFGTSGHRGSSLKGSFNEAHIISTVVAIAAYREKSGINGRLFVGIDTHLLSLPAFKTSLEVLVAMKVNVAIDTHLTFESFSRAISGNDSTNLPIWTPTPAVSHAILKANSENGQLRTEAIAADVSNPATTEGLSDGIVITPSHNPPQDGGYKYNPSHGGPADERATGWIANYANELLKNEQWRKIERVDFASALNSEYVERYDFRENYVADLENVIDFDIIREKNIRIGADPLGGAATEYWGFIAKKYQINLEVVNNQVDPAWPFMTLDWDEKIRMDCSSKNSMQGLVNRFNEDSTKYDIGTGNDADSDRHGIVTPNALSKQSGIAEIDCNNEYIPGLMNPNHFLAVCIDYLFSKNRSGWSNCVKVGKTLVSSSLIDRVCEGIGASMCETPVGFKWFVNGLITSQFGFGGEESAGASFLRKDGTVWTTDKDGIILDLLAAEITARTGMNPSEYHRKLIQKYGQSWYERIDAPASIEQKTKLKNLSAQNVVADKLGGEKIIAKLTKAPGNNSDIGGLKCVTKNAWFAARPSGTENVYKIYAESFVSYDHLKEIQKEAQAVVDAAIS